MSAAQQPSGLMAWFSSPNEWSVVFSKAGLQDIHITSCCAPVCLRRANLVKVTLCGSLSVQTQQQRPASPLGLCHDSPLTTHTQYMQHRYPVFLLLFFSVHVSYIINTGRSPTTEEEPPLKCSAGFQTRIDHFYNPLVIVASTSHIHKFMKPNCIFFCKLN